MVVVAVNMNTIAQSITIDVHNGCLGSFAKYTTSETKDLGNDGVLTLTNNAASVMLDAQSVTTLVSQ